MKRGDELRLFSKDHDGPVLVHHDELITALAALVLTWNCEVTIRLAPELANVCAALRAAGRPYATIERTEDKA